MDPRAVFAVVVLFGAALAVLPGGEAGTIACNLDVSIVLDKSGSMNGEPGKAARAGALELVGKIHPTGDHSGVRNFAPETVDDKSLDTDHVATKKGIDSTTGPPLGTVDMPTAVANSHNDFMKDGRPTARWVMVILSDGVNPDSKSQAASARSDGVEIYSVAIGPSADTAHMKALSSSPASKYYKEAITEADAKKAMAELIADMVCELTPILEVDVSCSPWFSLFRDFSKVDPTATIVKSVWDFGDGDVETHAPPVATLKHKYMAPGTYTVSLSVEDSRGFVETVKKTITVEPCPPMPPTASFQCKVDPDTFGLMHFIDGSSDINGPIVAWSWDFGDGATASGPDPVHTYEKKGDHLVQLTVTDTDGDTAKGGRFCRVTQETPPVMDPLPDITVYEGETIQFVVTASDADGDPLAYSWTGGTAPQDAAFAGQAFTWNTYQGSAGVYGPLTFTVSDGRFEDTASMSIRVLRVGEEAAPGAADGDGDGAADGQDNCPYMENPSQADADGDGIGDDCDPEPGLPEPAPPAPTQPSSEPGPGPGPIVLLGACTADPAAGDLDGDGVADPCDADPDGDRVPSLGPLGGPEDNCPAVPNHDQGDADGDGLGDLCDEDCDCDGPPAIAARDGAASASLPWTGIGLAVALLAAAGVVLLLVRRRRGPS